MFVETEVDIVNCSGLAQELYQWQICLVLLGRGFLLFTGNSFNGNVNLIILLSLLNLRTACETLMMVVTRGILILGFVTYIRIKY
jgi:hypothetical protein